MKFVDGGAKVQSYQINVSRCPWFRRGVMCSAESCRARKSTPERSAVCTQQLYPPICRPFNDVTFNNMTFLQIKTAANDIVFTRFFIFYFIFVFFFFICQRYRLQSWKIELNMGVGIEFVRWPCSCRLTGSLTRIGKQFDGVQYWNLIWRVWLNYSISC